MKIKSFHAIVMVAVAACATGVAQSIYYVGPEGDDSDGLSWGTAKRSVQAAVALAVNAGDEVVVTNGVYRETIASANRAIVIRSVEGAAVTVIDGGGVNRCATLGTATTHTNTVLAGFTLRNGRLANGGGVYGGTLHDCVVSGNVSPSGNGGGSYYGVLYNCVLSGNAVTGGGGGAYYGTLVNCTVSGNSATGSGGGMNASVMTNCVVSGNSAGSTGGGAQGGTLVGCVVSGNLAGTQGGGVNGGALYNCTVSGNLAGTVGGGVNSSGNRYNCIIWDNFVTSGTTTNYSSGTLLSTCTAPTISGVGNIVADPMFRLAEAGDFRLMSGSPCIDAGSNIFAYGAADVLGNARIQNGRVDMGAYEEAGSVSSDPDDVAWNVVASTEDGDGIRVTWEAPVNGGAVLYRVVRWNEALAQWVSVSPWSAERSFFDVWTPVFEERTYAVLTALDAGCDVISELSVPATGWRGASYYVDAGRSDDSGDGRSWATAKRTIQAAADLAVGGEMILVTNGVYEPFSTANKAIVIQSVEGASETFVDGGGTNRPATLGTATSHNATVLIGFTLRNGRMTANSTHGGGAYGGTLHDCVLTGNSVTGNTSNGGGSCYSILHRCTLSGNTATTSGGGAYYGTLNNCVLSGNTATSGGGSNQGTLNSCVLTGNTATGANGGGGSNSGTLNNCTVVGNTSNGGGGTANGTLRNCIVWGNTSTSGVNANYYLGTFLYSCTTPLPSGTGNTEENPLLRMFGAGDYRLTAFSPCLDTGADTYATTATDVIGEPRIQGLRVDMGAYEGVWGLSADPDDVVQNVQASADNRDGIWVTWEAPENDAVLYRVVRWDTGMGEWVAASGWIAGTSFLDTQVFAFEEYAYKVVAAFDGNFDTLSVSAPVTGERVPSYYVDAEHGSDGADGWTWATAKETLPAVVSLAVDYETIVVTNGIYASIVSDNKLIVIRSVEGAQETVIDGGAAARCATLGSAATHTRTRLMGFTLTNGKGVDGGGSYGGTLTDCVLATNTATGNGGGAAYGILTRCTLAGNVGMGSGNGGGGAWNSTLNSCTVTGNTAARAGGGAYGGTLSDCAVTDNTAGMNGGGTYESTLARCTVTGNTATGNGGGVGAGSASSVANNCVIAHNTAGGVGGGTHYGTHNNCLIVDNTAQGGNGGGAAFGVLNNCTVVHNRTEDIGSGGVHAATVNNCIVWGNVGATGETNNFTQDGSSSMNIRYTCSTPLQVGVGNTDAPPLFRLPEAGDFRLMALSPCLDTGSATYVNGTTDVLGNARVQGIAVDMGAYEGAWARSDDPDDVAQNVSASVDRTDGIFVEWDAPINGAALYRVVRWEGGTGIPARCSLHDQECPCHLWTPASGWIAETSFLDTEVFAFGECAYAVVAAFDENFEAVSEPCAPVTGRRLPSYYVDAGQADDAGDGKSWATAKKSIQAAIDLAVAGDGIAVTNGIYESIVTDNKRILIQSVEGARATVIDGGNANRPATLGTATMRRAAVLAGFTLTHGSAANGGGAAYGTLFDCVVTDNVAVTSGGGTYYSMLHDCTVRRNRVTGGNGGGAFGGTLRGCVLTGNTAPNGGGADSAILIRCLVTENAATSQGGGVRNGRLVYSEVFGNTGGTGAGLNAVWTRHAVVAGNVASADGGGSANNANLQLQLFGVTIARNRAARGGGVYLTQPLFGNCILWDNVDNNGDVSNWSNVPTSDGTTYSCTTPTLKGTGNTDEAPRFRLPEAMDFRLLAGSPCIDTGRNGEPGNNWGPLATDVIGNPRLQGVTMDMGAYEGEGTLCDTPADLVRNLAASTDNAAGILLTWDAPSSGGILPPSVMSYRVLRWNAALEMWIPVSFWFAGEAFLDEDAKPGEETYAVIAAFDENKDAISVLSASVTGQRGAAWFVDAGQADDAGDGKSWATAKQTIQAAVDLAMAGDIIAVTNGVYAPIATDNKRITIQSVNGVEHTAIDGGNTNRCATLGASGGETFSALVGFTLRNGYISGSGGASLYGTLSDCVLSNNVANFGGGAYGGILSRCLFADNRANNDGGGVNNATVAHGTMTGNTAANGGGAAYGALFDCAISGNKGGSGGGMYNGTLANCTISGNTATGSGGGAYGSVMTNCVVSGNASATSGGGAYNGTMVSGLLSENVATGNGGGMYGCTLHNCTVAGNRANNGGGTYNGTMNNCVVWGNAVNSGVNTNYYAGTWRYSCSLPVPGGTVNMEQDPMFRFAEAGDFRLLEGSPCIDAGTNYYAYGATDLAGNPRIQGLRVDMGAYEGEAAALRDDPADLVQNLHASDDDRDGIWVSWDAPLSGDAALYRVLRFNGATGQWEPVSGWISEQAFFDTGMLTGVEYTYAVVTAFDAKLAALSVTSASATGQRGASWYVDAEHGDDVNDGMAWATAKQTIQAAIDLAVADETIAVTNGVYAPITSTNKTVFVRSVEGAAVTIIDGGGTNRCATLGSATAHTNIILTGFTLTNGKITGDGGGAFYGTLTDCALTGNPATRHGGG
ncbi:MAG: fibronectin type III domain-containing protein, partial [Kiritimatiellaeota bacterium]|nr:fibronectin type III domain-containing protein [Kiritimatiellota bacterium]